MTRISNTSSVTKKRMHSSYVERSTNINRLMGVEPVNPVNHVSNNTSNSSSNHLISSDIFYDKLEALKEEYIKFYHHGRNLERTIEDIQSKEELLLENMKELIDKYNKAIISLDSFDKHLNTYHTKSIILIINEFQKELDKIGISIVKTKELKIDEDKFTNSITYSTDSLSEIFKPIRSMILRLYKAFRSIKGPNKETFDRKFDSFENMEYKGMIINSKG